METKIFMNILAIVLAAAGIIYACRKWIRKHLLSDLHGFLPTGPPEINQPIHIYGYLKEAGRTLPAFKKIGGILVVTYVAHVIIFSLFWEFFSNSKAMESQIRQAIAFQDGPSVHKILRSFHTILVHDSIKIINKGFSSADNLFLILVILFLLNRLKDNIEGALKKKLKFVFFALIFCFAIEIAYTLYFYSLVNKEQVYSATAFTFKEVFGYVYIAAGIFPASIAEGIFLFMLFNYFRRKKAILENALAAAIKLVRSLFFFNLIFYSLYHFFPWYPKFITKSITWFPAILFFMTPFLIARESLSFRAAIKKNLQVFYKLPLDYFTLMVTICIAASALKYLLDVFSFYIYRPLLLNTTMPYSLWVVGQQLINGVICISFSLFAFCVIGAFVQKNSSVKFAGSKNFRKI